ncbi:hypothetical protein AcW2_006957 [Taiwanofungus camphoratus]|nr:hypothetical protein AcW2_006957 [Antrodia cinnamomea]
MVRTTVTPGVNETERRSYRRNTKYLRLPCNLCNYLNLATMPAPAPLMDASSLVETAFHPQLRLSSTPIHSYTRNRMLYYSHDTMEVGRAAEAVQLPESGVPAQASKGFQC